jgi:hypothetical protein
VDSSFVPGTNEMREIFDRINDWYFVKYFAACSV